MKDSFVRHIHSLQQEICSSIEACDGGAVFSEDKWERQGGGGGVTKVIGNGNVFEKGGVNISEVHGKLPETVKQSLKVKVNGDDFFACGISLVIHPHNPMVPTVHANFRYFELYDVSGKIIDQWFGGGADLTPYYLFEEDAVHFHRTFKDVCDKFSPDFYPRFKKQCDDYFVNSHRSNESRGIGGIFFDYLRPDAEHDAAFWHDFTIHCSQAFLPAYLPVVEKRRKLSFTEQNKFWQEIRRGRYVEFNLIHDRGTLFGLKTNGRTESILMSLPPTVRWEYNYQPAYGSDEDRLQHVLMNPKDWV